MILSITAGVDGRALVWVSPLETLPPRVDADQGSAGRFRGEPSCPRGPDGMEGFVGGVEYWERREARGLGRLVDDWPDRWNVAAKDLWVDLS